MLNDSEQAQWCVIVYDAAVPTAKLQLPFIYLGT